MMLVASQPKNPLTPEGTYPATLKSITPLPDDKSPKKVGLNFKIEGGEFVVSSLSK